MYCNIQHDITLLVVIVRTNFQTSKKKSANLLQLCGDISYLTAA